MRKKQAASMNYTDSFSSLIREKYPHILTGIVVLLLIFSFIFSLFQKKAAPLPKKLVVSEKVIKQEIPVVSVKQEIKQYVVKPGDYLWKIAEEKYGDGFKAVEIAKANNLENPDLIFAEQELNLPEITPQPKINGDITLKAALTSQVLKKVDKYITKPGDYLWKIAEEVYGDGYAWVRIAKANNLANPDLIFSNQTLTIP